MHKQEMRTSEFLFLPRKREEKKEEQKGSRVSRRLLKQQREKEAMREITGRDELRSISVFSFRPYDLMLYTHFFLLYLICLKLARSKTAERTST